MAVKRIKSLQKVTRLQLNTDSAEDYLLLGLVSADADYKLSLAINRTLKISLKNTSPVELNQENGSLCLFSKFSDQSPVSGLTFSLYSNKSGKEFLLKKLKKIDYVLQVYSPEGDFNFESITAPLRSIDSITAIFTLQPGNIKDKNIQYLIP